MHHYSSSTTGFSISTRNLSITAIGVAVFKDNHSLPFLCFIIIDELAVRFVKSLCSFDIIHFSSLVMKSIHFT